MHLFLDLGLRPFCCHFPSHHNFIHMLPHAGGGWEWFLGEMAGSGKYNNASPSIWRKQVSTPNLKSL